MQPLELTLIVAATRNMGIGAHGTMPWTGLRKEMKFFARVTTRLAPQVFQPHATFASEILETSEMIQNTRQNMLTKYKTPSTSLNAVIMGRKTWDSIPTKFRPLKDRLNIIITRSAPTTLPPAAGPADPRAEPVKVCSLEHALQYARTRADVGRVFVMGGAQIYDAALKLPEARRVLLTSIERDFECDTFFPIELNGEESGPWVKRPREELESWTGEEIEEGGQEEAGTKYEFQMWEKTN
ncbi:dihydrofolate reductase [Fusarium albosuccineum]|uniref:Dihydrofolate reductase n=1 Tax=Fusarium albosuccineum TaxID=1237068 RepID=A0A8H4L3G0_9HYPO|nr:dihydrofolate reductase [Fusarium albosuccineum]